MTRTCYIAKTFRAETLEIIDQAQQILTEYDEQGFTLTLRQLYYQFVARGLLENSVPAYKRLGTIVKDARLAGLIDWEWITDRTRHVRKTPHWSSPAEIIETAAASFAVDKWQDQEFRPEAWIEKDALVGVIEPTCSELDVPYFSCRGYNSESEMWSAAQRFLHWSASGQRPIVIHLGDHDPSGIDMSRDIEARLERFAPGVVSVVRIALNRDQIDQHDPPPNPAKTTDTRSRDYIRKFGHDSWELDALEPATICELVVAAVKQFRDPELWAEQQATESAHKRSLQSLVRSWDRILPLLGGSQSGPPF